MHQYFLRAAGTLALLAVFATSSAHDLEVTDAWVRAAPPNAPALGVFMNLKNHSGSEMKIVGARTSLEVERVELHRTMMVGDVMKMVPQESIPIGPDASLKLKPGSWHVMLIGPAKVPQKGDAVSLTLEWSDGTDQQVSAVVRKGKKMMHGHGHNKGHGQGHGKSKGHGQGHGQMMNHE